MCRLSVVVSGPDWLGDYFSPVQWAEGLYLTNRWPFRILKADQAFALFIGRSRQHFSFPFQFMTLYIYRRIIILKKKIFFQFLLKSVNEDVNLKKDVRQPNYKFVKKKGVQERTFFEYRKENPFTERRITC